MPSPLDRLPPALGRVDTRPLFTMKLSVEPPTDLGDTPLGRRRVVVVSGGTFESDRPGLNGRVLPGGADWLTFHDSGVVTLDVRLVLETGDGEAIGMTYKGVRRGPADVMDRLVRGEDVDPSEYYFRAAPVFETGCERFGWLNHVVTVATGHRYPDGPLYSVFEVL